MKRGYSETFVKVFFFKIFINIDRRRQPRSQGPLLLGPSGGENPGNEVEEEGVGRAYAVLVLIEAACKVIYPELSQHFVIKIVV